MVRPGDSGGSSRQPGRDSSRRVRRDEERATVIGGARGGTIQSMASTALPPFRTVAPPGHSVTQPRESTLLGAPIEQPGYSTIQPSQSRSSFSRASESSRSATRSQAPTQMSRITRGMRNTHLSTLDEQPEGTRTAGPRATTIAPIRGTAFDVADHGVFESDSEDEDEGTAVPARGGGFDTRSVSGRTTAGVSSRGTALGNRTSGTAVSAARRPETATARTSRGGTLTGSTRLPETVMSSYSRAGTAIGSTSRRTQLADTSLQGSSRTSVSSRAPTAYGRTTVRPSGLQQTSYPPLQDDDSYEGDEDEADEDNGAQPAAAVRAQTEWYDPANPPRPHPPGYRDENLIYRIEGDDFEVFQYVMLNERADGGLALLEEIDRRARHLRDPHFSALELWTRAYNSGFLRKIVANDDGYSYWTIENHNYDVAWACAQQGWMILGTGVGKDKGNFFMEQKEGR